MAGSGNTGHSAVKLDRLHIVSSKHSPLDGDRRLPLLRRHSGRQTCCSDL